MDADGAVVLEQDHPLPGAEPGRQAPLVQDRAAADEAAHGSRAESQTGLAVPGMPKSTPGMAVPGDTPEPYEVLAFARDGKTTVFAKH